MAIRPKYTACKQGNIVQPVRRFTDREEYIKTFISALLGNKKDSYNILVFYGVGGIGKTSLRKHLTEIIKSEYADIITACIDFDLPVYRQEETALYYLRNILRDNYKIQFLSFEIAYAVYWQKTHPQTALNKASFSLLDDSELLTDLLAVVGEIPLISLLPNLAKITMKGKSMFKNWWTKRGQKELYNLPELEAKDILARLPMFFASDLKDYLETNSKRCVLFMDTYEALWEYTQTEGSYFLRDEWIRELTAQLTEPLWVICGREKIRWTETDKDWEQYIEHKLIGGLSNIDAGEYLQSCGITNHSVKDIIINSSKGIPHYLNLAVDTYFRISEKFSREPVREDFASAQSEVVDRFLRYLDKFEIETLKVLSVPRFWNREIFKKLIDEFKTGYPITAFDEVTRFSFIQQDDDNKTYNIHDLMREGLLNRIYPDTVKQIHGFMFGFYCSKLTDVDIKNITDEQCCALNEAFYHAKNSLSFDDMSKWFTEISSGFDRAAKWNILIPLWEEMVALTRTEKGENSFEYAVMLGSLAGFFKDIGNFTESLRLLKEAVEIYTVSGLINCSEYLAALGDLAFIYKNKGDFGNAVKLINECLAKLKNLKGETNIQYANLLDTLGFIYHELGEYDKALEQLGRSLAIEKEILGENDINYIISLQNIASVYEKKGEHSRAIELFTESMNKMKIMLGENHPDYSNLLSNLANTYTLTENYSKAIEMYEKSLMIDKSTFGEENYRYAIGLNNLGGVYRRKGEYEKASELINRSLKILKNSVGESHHYYAIVLHRLAGLYNDKGEYEKARGIIEQSLTVLKGTVGERHPEYAKSLYDLALIKEKTGDEKNALSLYLQALSICSEKLSRGNHLTVTIMKSIAGSYKKSGMLKEAEEMEGKIKELQL